MAYNVNDGETTFFHVHVSYLIPDWNAPCNIYIYSKGKFIEIIKANTPIPIQALIQLKSSRLSFGQIKTSDRVLWDEWIKRRYAGPKEISNTIDTVEKGVLVNMAKYIQLGLDKFVLKGEEFDSIRMVEYHKKFKLYANNPLIRWFFQEDIDNKIVECNARLGYLMLLFFELTKIIPQGDEVETAIFSAMVHRVNDENPKRPDIPSVNTLKFLKRKNIALPADMIHALAMQDEHHDGSGFPNKISGDNIPLHVGVFHIARIFNDACGEITVGSKREKMEKARLKVAGEAEHCYPGLVEVFFHFLDTIEFRK